MHFGNHLQRADRQDSHIGNLNTPAMAPGDLRNSVATPRGTVATQPRPRHLPRHPQRDWSTA